MFLYIRKMVRYLLDLVAPPLPQVSEADDEIMVQPVVRDLITVECSGLLISPQDLSYLV
jgi:hypothetical protein